MINLTVAELIQKLKDLPQDADIFYGCEEGRPEEDGLSKFTLYDFIPVHYNKVRSYRSESSQWSPRENVVVLEYD